MSDEAKIRRLQTWLRENGAAFHPDIAIKFNDQRGYYASALQDLTILHDKLAICTCPFALSISILNIPRIRDRLGLNVRDIGHDAGAVAEYLADRVDKSVLGHFVLMEQRLLAERSFWFPYIDMLPTESELSTPLYFDERDLEWLQGTNMHLSPGKSAIENRREAHRREWTAAVAALEQSNHLGVSQFTFELYLWAATIFTSRSFSFSAAFGIPGDGFSILYPGIDILNHSPEAKVSWDFSSGDFALSTRASVEKGAEVFNNYAPKGNEELLMGYGFAIGNNPTDTVRIVLPEPPAQVHKNLRKVLPDHFKSEIWDSDEATFLLRGKAHVAGPYDHGIECLRGVPIAMFRMMAETIFLMSTGQSDGAEEALEDEDFFTMVIEQFLDPIRNKRDAIRPLGEEPETSKQAFAKIYRSGQARILDDIIADLSDFLASGTTDT